MIWITNFLCNKSTLFRLNPLLSIYATVISNGLSGRNIKFWVNKAIDLGEAGYHASQKFS